MQQDRKSSDAMRNQKSAGGALTHRMFVKNVKGIQNQYQENIANISHSKQVLNKISITSELNNAVAVNLIQYRSQEKKAANASLRY